MNSHENVTVKSGNDCVPILLTCEHANNLVPEEYNNLGLSEEDLNTHWSIDLGILNVFNAAQKDLRCMAIHSNYNRLLVDLNRPATSIQLSRAIIGTGLPNDRFREVPGNQDLSLKEKQKRLEQYYRPFHQTIDTLGDQLVARHGDYTLIVSLHSFTPVFGTEKRDFDIGLVFHHETLLISVLYEFLTSHGLKVRFNEPYSGKQGLNFSPYAHGLSLGCRQIELEINQGYLATVGKQKEVGEILAMAFRSLLIHH